MSFAVRCLTMMPVLALAVCAYSAEPVKTRVQLESQPTGASAIVDGKDRGTTPLMLFDLPAGKHRVKYRLPGYEDCVAFFRCGAEPVVTCSETLPEVKGLLLLRSEPAGADISVNGVSVGVTPRLITHLSAKETYTVKLVKTGYLDQLIKVKFEGRKPLVRNEKLVLASGTIDILSEPAGAQVSVNGIPKGRSPLKVEQVPRGRAVVKFTLDGYDDEIRELTISAGDVQTLPVAMKAKPGTLHLVSVPAGARFYVNDKPVGKGEQVLSGMAAGTYVVRAELEGYGAVSREIQLEKGASASEEFRLSNVRGSIEVKTTPPGAQVYLDGKLVGTTKGASESQPSEVLTISDVLEGEHQLIVRKDGYGERMRRPKVQRGKASHWNLKLPRLFVPNVEVVTAGASYKGVLISNGADGVTIEIKPGVTQSIPREKVRKLNFLDGEKGKASK